MAEALYIVDGSGFVFRAYHALPPLSTRAGVPTGAVYGFAQMMIKLEQDYRPSHLVVVFDHSDRSFRNDLYAEYKAHRPPAPEDLSLQFPMVRRIVDAFGVQRLELAAVEADDVIASLTRRARERGIPVVIVSSDKDMMQLVGDGVVMIETMKNVVYDPAAVEEKFGVPPAKLGDVLALMGDSVDNVPGIPGIGPKTAAQLIREFGSLEAMLARPDDIAKMKLRGAERVRKLVVEHAEQARLSRRLVTLDEDVALPVDVGTLARHEPDMAVVADTLRELEFDRLLERLKPAGAPTAAPPAAAPEAGSIGARPTEVVLTAETLRARVASLAGAGEIGLALAMAGSGPWAAPIGIALAADGAAPIYVPVGHRYIGAPAQLEAAPAIALLAPLLGDGKVRKHIHSHKAAHLLFSRFGVALAGVAGDPELDSYLLDPSQPHDLAALAAKAGGSVEEREALCGSGKKAIELDMIEIERAARFCGCRAEASLLLGLRLGERVVAAGMGALLTEVELPLGRVLAVIERHGVRLDVAHLQRLGVETQQKLDALEDEVRGLAGYPINLGSPKQLQELLFEKLQLPATKKTKTGYSTDAEVLEELAELHPIAARIHEHRALAKLKGTYIDALPHFVDPKSGRLHTSYNQTVAATGRLSSEEPNLQNIPIRSELGREIRRAFIADPGCRLIAADYSQIELRVLAHLSHDEVLCDAFARDQDVHERTACEMFKVEPSAVGPEMRRIAKAINYGIVYGQTDFGLARAVGIPREEARRYIDEYFARYHGVARTMAELIATARREHGARTLFGRFRPLADIDSKNRAQRQYAERMARNTPIQGTAADLIKMAMIAVQARLESEAPSARMLLTVHDELVLEAPEAEAERVSRMTCEVMENVFPLDVPLKVEAGIGLNWAEC